MSLAEPRGGQPGISFVRLIPDWLGLPPGCSDTPRILAPGPMGGVVRKGREGEEGHEGMGGGCTEREGKGEERARNW